MDSVNKYKSYDFFTDENWTSYSSSIFPQPTRNQLEKIRRKWYQANIDPSLNVKFDSNPNETPTEENTKENEEEKVPNIQASSEQKESKEQKKAEPEIKTEQKSEKKEEKPKESSNFQQQPQTHQHDHNCNHSQSQTKTTVPALTNILFSFEGFLKFSFLVSLILLQEYASWIALAICVLALIRQCKRPRWNKEYAEKLMYNEYFHNIWYMIPFLLFPKQQSLLYFVPLTIHIWIGLCEYINLKNGKLLTIFKSPVEKTRNRRVYLMSLKQKFEIYLFFNLIIYFFFAQSNLLIIVLYSNYLRIKYVVNRNLITAIFEIDLWIRNHIVKETSPRIIKWLYRKIVQFCSYMVTPTTAAAAVNKKKDEEKKEEEKKTN